MSYALAYPKKELREKLSKTQHPALSFQKNIENQEPGTYWDRPHIAFLDVENLPKIFLRGNLSWSEYMEKRRQEEEKNASKVKARVR